MNPPPVQVWSGIVVVTGPALRSAADAVLIAINSRRLSGRPRSKILDELAAAFLNAASADGHSDVRDAVIPQSLPTVPIDEAATRMNLSHRQVRRKASALGGQKIGGRWFLDEEAINEHMEGQVSGQRIA